MAIIPRNIDIHVHFDKIVVEIIKNEGDLTSEEAKTLIAKAAPTLERLKAIGKDQ